MTCEDALAAAIERAASQYEHMQSDSAGIKLDRDVAVEEVNRLCRELGKRDSEIGRLREALRQISGWDCLNPPQAEILADLPWLRRLVDDALAPAESSSKEPTE